MIPRFPVYLFDVDGTLLDSAPDICAAVRESLAPLHPPELSEAYLRGFIGHHLRDLYLEVFPHLSEEEVMALVMAYRKIYAARGHSATSVFAGTAAVLSRLGGRKSTATTKSTETTRLILTQFGLAPYFDHIQGTDGFPAKPAPDVILKSIEVLGVRPEECLLVGDAGPDMQAGRAAGVKTCAVTWGYGDAAAMREHQPDYWIDSLGQLLA